MMDKAYFLKTLATFRVLIRDKEEYPDVVLNQYYGALKGYSEAVWLDAQANVLREQEYRSMPLIGTFIKACEAVREDKKYALLHPNVKQLQIEDKDGQPPTPEEYDEIRKYLDDVVSKIAGKFTI